MKKLLIAISILLLSTLFISCAKDSVIINPIPTVKVSLQTVSLTDSTIYLTASVVSSSKSLTQDVVRGFLYSKDSNLTILTSEDIIWANRGTGTFESKIQLTTHNTYFVTAFTYISGHADNVSYSIIKQVNIK